MFDFSILFLLTCSSSFCFLVNWKIVNPVLKIGAPLCISFQVKAPQCTVHFDNKTISYNADQYGSIRVHANGKNCILCIHNFHLANHTINRPIQIDSGLDRIATTSLQDILTEYGLVGECSIFLFIEVLNSL